MANFVITTLVDETSQGGTQAAETADGAGLSLREALVLTNANADADTITFDATLTGGTLFLTTGQQLEITTDGITVDGDIDGNGTADITISADSTDGADDATSRVFSISDGAGTTISATLNGLVIRDGNAIGERGGGIYVAGSEALTLSNSTVADNSTSSFGFVSGGGISNSGTATLTNVTLSGNSAAGGGGGILNNGTAILTNVTLSDNSAPGDGGGIFNNGTAILTNVALSDNSARDGGGIFNFNGTATLTNTTLSGNSAGNDGGGIFNDTGTAATLTNTTLWGNSAGDDGGGIYDGVLSTVRLTNTTLSGNSAGNDGGGISHNGSFSNVIVNSIVAGNKAGIAGDDIEGSVGKSGRNIVGSNVFNNSIDIGDTTLADIFADVVTVDPDGAGTGNDPFQAGKLADNGGPVMTIALNASVTNPALDASNATAPTADARGLARLDQPYVADANGTTADIGAFEMQLAQSFEVTTLDDELDSADPNATLVDFGGLTDLSLREALVLANRDPTTADTITFDDTLVAGGLGADGVITLAFAQGELVVDGDVTIDGDVNGGAPDITISGAVSDSAVIHVYRGAVTLNGLTIQDGYASYGAGVSVGTYCGCDTADVTISNSVIRNNDAGYGGGIAVGYGSSLRLIDSTVTENAALYGGGIYNAGDLTVIRSTFFDNAGYNGGGIANYQGTARIINSTFSGNTAGVGGGIANYEGTLSLINTTLHGNFALVAGGGLASIDGDLSVISSTVTGNLADIEGGGIATDDLSVTITNSIVAGNAADSAAPTPSDVFVAPTGAAVTYTGLNVLSEGTGSPNVTIETNLDNIFAALEQIDPDDTVAGDEFQAGALANNGGPVETILILAGGAAHNVGDNGELPDDTEDLDGDTFTNDLLPVDARGPGFAREVGVLDIGAVELQETAPVLDAAKTPLLDAVDEDSSAPVNGTAVGTLVSSLVDLDPPAGGFDNVTDLDGDTETGIALTNVNTANGAWFYTIDGGATWNAVGAVSDTSARLLAADADTRLYFQPTTADFNGPIADAITFRAWDLRTGANGQDGVDVSTNGGTTAFSSATDTANITVTPVNDLAVSRTGGITAALEQIATAADPGFIVVDPDSLTLARARVAITVNFAAGQDVLGFVNDGVSMGNVTAVYDGTTGVLDLTSAGTLATLAQWQAALRSVTYLNTSDTPSTATRTLSFSLDDGGGFGAPATQQVSVSTVNDPTVLQNDAFAIFENGSVNGSVFANNGNGADADLDDTLTVTAVNGSAASVGTQIALASGALLTINANGTISYNTNGAFDHLPSPASGASYSTATDTFNYSAGGGTAQVTVTITGLGATDTEPRPDFNNDGKGDILWQHAGTGAVSLWLRDGSANPASFSQTQVGGAGDPNWRVASATGDFNGDGKSDILWEHTNGTVVQWLMDGTALKASGPIGGSGDPNWRIIGTGDFNGDGLSDIVWQHSNGAVTLWERRGDDPANFAQFSTVGGAGDPNWHVVATGDFNQDGRSDLLWQHDNGSATIWLLDGPSVTQAGLFGINGDPNWRVVATGDLNGDGTENDILWQHTNGAVDLWLHGNSTTTDDFQKFSSVGGAGDVNWRIEGTADVNGDGRSDILFEHAVSGAFVEWTMSGATITQQIPVAGFGDPSWQIVGLV